MKITLMKLAYLLEELGIYHVVEDSFVCNKLMGHTVLGLHPFILIRMELNNSYVSLTITNRFTSRQIFHTITALSDVDESCLFIQSYMNKYVVSEVV